MAIVAATLLLAMHVAAGQHAALHIDGADPGQVGGHCVACAVSTAPFRGAVAPHVAPGVEVAAHAGPTPPHMAPRRTPFVDSAPARGPPSAASQELIGR